MSDVFDRLEEQILKGMPEGLAATPRPRRRRAPRARLLLVATAAIAGLSTVAVAELTQQGTTVKPRSTELDLAAHYSIFRRPASDADSVRTQGGAPDTTLAGVTRLVLDGPDGRLYATDDGAGRLCLLLQSDTGAAHTCTAQDQAIKADLPPSLTLRDRAGSTTYLLLPDGVADVTATTVDGSASTVPVRDNGIVLPRDTDHATWATADGVKHSQDHLVPALPRTIADSGAG